MTPRIKICGITNPQDAQAAVKAGADALGFIFYSQSPRYVTPDRVKRIVASLPPFTLSVGVFVNESPEKVREIFDECGLAFAQLHGDETPEYCETVQRPVLRALRLRDRGNLLALAEYRGRTGVRGFVVDTYSETTYGGTGQPTDWNLAREAAQAAPILLAGGLTPENVGLAIQRVKPYGVDVSSGVEIQPGQKDHEKVHAFVQAVHLV